MINYYEILEVSEKASKEVIEKAYKALAKKYHPDLNHENPKLAEEKMKEINEAFDILMDDSKRSNYDNILAKKRLLEEKKSQINNFSNSSNTNSSFNTSNVSANDYYTDSNGNFYVNTHNMSEKDKKKLQAKLQERYLEAYDNYLRQRGYKLKYKWTFKKFMQVIAVILTSIVILTILFFIPPIHEYCLDLYENNILVKITVDIVISFFNAIISIFK